MSNLNNITLVGNVGNEPEQREFESGSKVTKFCIGVGRWNKRTEQEVTDWVDIETFSKMGDYVKKDGLCAVSGIIDTQAERVKKAVSEKGFVLKDEMKENDWCAFLFQKL